MEDRIPELYDNLLKAFEEYTEEVDSLRVGELRRLERLRSYEETIRKLAAAASVAERSLGRWEIVDEGPVLEGGQIVVRHPHVKCTACGRQAVEVPHMGQALTPFCPWCGAQMRMPGEKEADE